MIKVLESVEFEVVSTDMQRSWTNENLSDSPSLQSRPRLDSNQPYQNEQQSIVANAIALYGTKAAADGDVNTVTDLLNNACKEADDTFTISKFLEICDERGYNMLHVAIINKKMEIMEVLYEYGTCLINTPTKDEHQDSPLMLAIKSYNLQSKSPQEDHLLNSLPYKRMTSTMSPLETPVALQIIDRLVKFGADVNYSNSHGDTPLILAIKTQNAEVVKFLLRPTLNVNAKNSRKKTALHYAVASNDIEIANKLLDYNASVSQVDNDGYTPIHTACKYGREELLHHMFEKFPKKAQKILSQSTIDGKTPLFVAKCALRYSRRTVKFLISQGSDLKRVDKYRNTVLHLYSDKDDPTTCSEILCSPEGKDLIKQRNLNLETPLHVAASYGHYHTCYEILEHLQHDDREARDINGQTPIMRAIACGHESVVKAMLIFGYQINNNVKQHKTLLKWAIENDYSVLIMAMYSLCADKQADLEEVFDDLTVDNLVEMVTKIGKESILRLLFQADTKRVTDCCSKALHTAVTNGNLNCVKVLFEYNATLSCKGINDDTPLHIACRLGYTEIVKYLLSHGASTEICNHNEGPPLSCAAANGHHGLVLYLLSCGASLTGDCTMHDADRTPLIMAARHGHSNVVKVLLDQSTLDVNTKSTLGYNCLCEAIANFHRSTALTIIESDHWEKAMMFKTNCNETPMRMLIQHMPDVAELVLYKCISQTKDKTNNKTTSLTYSYKFINDYDTGNGSLIYKFMSSHGLVPGKRQRTALQRSFVEMTTSFTNHHVAEDLESMKSDDTNNIENDSNWLQTKYDKDKHPLQIMVNYRRMSLLEHPVVHEFLRYKWRYFGLPTFIFHFAFYLFYVLLITAVVLVAPLPQGDTCSVQGCWSNWGSWSDCSNGTGCSGRMTRARTRSCNMPEPGIGYQRGCPGSGMETMACNGTDDIDDGVNEIALGDNGSTILYCEDDCLHTVMAFKNLSCTEKGMNDFDLMLLRRGSILLTVDLFLLIILNFLKFLRRRLNYFKHLASWIDTTFQTLSVMCVTLHYKGTDDCFCSSTNTWQIAVITLFIGWIGLIVHLNKLPLTGIIINMLLSIFQTFIKLVIIATLLCFAFALPFYLLLSLPGRRTAFSDLQHSMLKTLVMTTGEFEFDTIFVNDQGLVDDGLVVPFPTLTTILWIIFVVTMPILFNNLLVGLAVGDTQEELSKAKLTKYQLQINIITELETAVPSLRNVGRSTEVTIDEKQSWFDRLFQTSKLEQKVMYLNEWRKKHHISQLFEDNDKIDPIEKIIAMQTELTKKLDYLETVLLKSSNTPSSDNKYVRKMKERAITLHDLSLKNVLSQSSLGYRVDH